MRRSRLVKVVAATALGLVSVLLAWFAVQLFLASLV